MSPAGGGRGWTVIADVMFSEILSWEFLIHLRHSGDMAEFPAISFIIRSLQKQTRREQKKIEN